MASTIGIRTHLSTWPTLVVLALLGALLTAVPASAATGAGARDRAEEKRLSELPCTIVGTRGDDVLVGTSGDDVICGGGGDDVLRGGGGDDVLRGGGSGDDRLVGGPGDDYLQGGRGDDLLRGGAGDDVMLGGRGDDRLQARDAARFEDVLRCDQGSRDRAYADAGDRVSPTCELPRRDAAPTDLALTPSSVVENAPVGTLVGSLSVTDVDKHDTHRFALVAGGTDNGSFTVDGTRLLTAAVLDFERDAALDVRVRVTDGSGASYEEDLVVTVLDVPENGAPVAVDDTSTTDEDTALVLPASGPGSPAANDVDSDPLSVTAVSAPVGGTVTLSAGVIRFVPTADLCGAGAGRFDYTVSDGKGGTDVGRVTVDVTCVPDDPEASDDTATVDEDSAAQAVTVLDNDSDADGDDLAIGSVSQPDHGTVVITGGGAGLTYAPDADYCNSGQGGTPDTFSYSLAPGGSSADVAITVTCVDDAPVAVDDAATVVEDAGAGAIAVLANDTDLDGGPRTIESVTQPAHGTVVITGSGSGLTYAPDADYCNAPGGPEDTFTYTLNGGDSATVSVTATCVDDAPVAVDDAATLVEDASATAIGVLANDTDVDGGTTTIDTVTQPAHGTVAITGGGTGLTYEPDADYCNAPGGGVPDAAPDTFTYTLNGGGTAAVSVTVSCVDDRPVAVDDAATTDEDATAQLDVLANDTDVDGGQKSVASVTQPSHGTATVTGGGTGVSYAPDANSCTTGVGGSPDTFTYTLNGGTSATVSVTVTCVDDAPVAVADAASVMVDADPTAIDVLANDTDVDDGPLTIASVTQPANGTVTLAGTPATVSYEPDPGYCNTGGTASPDTFTYTLNGGSTATVSVTVSCDVPPTAVADAATVAEDSGSTAIDVLANDTDPDGGPKSVASVTQPARGTVVITGGGAAVTYAPEANYCNSGTGGTPDTFTYTLNGGGTATVSVTVTCVDDGPVAVADARTVAEDSGATSIDVRSNDTDVDGGPSSISSVTQPAHGTAAITGGGTAVTYAPAADYCGPDSFTYTLSPGGSTATVTMTVTCVNDAPVADDETISGAIGNTTLIVDDPTDGAPTVSNASRTVSGDILDGDTDVDGPGPLVVTAGTFATNDGGQVVLEADGDFVFTPAAGTSCTDTSDFFDYTVSDSAATPASDTGRVTIQVTDCVWYVSNNAPGNAGTSSAPFDTLAQAESASAPNHTIYLLDGDDTTTGRAAGFALKPGQRLVGEAANLFAGAVLLRSAVPGARPTITNTNADVLALATGSSVRGVEVDPQGTGGGISGGAGVGGVVLQDVRIIDSGTPGSQPGLELDGTTGSSAVTGLVVETAGATGIRLNNAGTVVFGTGNGATTVRTDGAKALDVTGTSLTGSTFGSIVVTGSAVGGISLSNTTGAVSLGDGAQGDISLTGMTGTTPAFRLANAPSVTVPASGTSDVSITGGPAIDVVSAAGANLSFDDVDSTGSTGDGINLSGLGAGTFSAATGSTITNASDTAFDLDGGSGAVTYDGAITNDVGRLLRVNGTTGGVKDFNGAITDNGDGDGGELGVQLTGNTGATVRLDGGLVVRTTTQPAFTATGGGTVAVSAASDANSLQATTGTPLTVTGTAIHADGLTFRSIASNGAVNGVVLSGTGMGRLAVTGGTGTACTVATPTCSGGKILSSSGPGILLSNVPGGVSLSQVQVGQGLDDGIRATTVGDLDLSDVLVTGNGDSHAGGAEERGLDYLDVTGSPQILRTVVSGSDDSNAHIRNTTGTTTLSVDGSTFTGSKNNAGLRIRGEGSSTMTATVQRSVFSLNADPGFSMQTDAANTARQTLVFDDNDVSGGSPSAVPGRPQVSINAGSGAIVKARVSNNDIKSAAGSELILNTLPGHTGTFDATVVGNDIGDAQPGALDPQVDAGVGIWGWAHGSGATRIEVRNNTIANWGGSALTLSHNEGSGSADYTATGNSFGAADAGPNAFEGVYVLAGGATGDTSDVCVDLENNVGLQSAGQQGLPDVAMDRFGSASLRFADVVTPSAAAVQSSLASKNPGSPGLTFETYGAEPTGTSATACQLAQGTP
ncbi:Ig-like domain-containing protein [Nocardioides KLBMP 9356]|uniref:Ig-like domain-containing protein n=1 Tax=Nocardioides potassii TaxID=2911371 RepID=A0ABS9H8Y4_9ACTN|nr:Ig-like domain-containing protein [Nocardioides potassii]MCF6376699.1 Ig-like domain-containing protein [Nocardioides potassii]